MRRPLLLNVFFAVVFSGSGLIATADEADVSNSKKDESSSFSLGSRVLTVTEVVMKNHIDPPTRQQMILAGIKALYRADKRLAPKGLSERISALATPEQITDYLEGVRAEFNKLQNLEAILMNGILRALPGRAYLIDANNSKVSEQLAANRYVGTGIALTMSKEEKLPAIHKVFYKGPAWQAGVKRGDLIVEIEGEATASRNLSQVVQQLRGEAGSEVTVVVRQPNSEESRKLTITLGRVFIATVEGYREKSEGEWQYTIDSATDIALIRLRSIGPSTLHELRQVRDKLRRENIGGIILDLRSGGAILHDVVMVADSLLDGGTIGHIRSLDSVKKHEARPGAFFQDLPMAVLVGKHTSPGYVFLIAALQDHKRAIVVGEPTSGQTYVSSIVPVPGRSEKIRMATAVMQRGDGTPLLATSSRSLPITNNQVPKTAKRKKRPGFIMPDHVVANGIKEPPSPKQLGMDSMLAKAIEVLRNAAPQAPSRPKSKSASE